MDEADELVFCLNAAEIERLASLTQEPSLVKSEQTEGKERKTATTGSGSVKTEQNGDALEWSVAARQLLTACAAGAVRPKP